MKSGNIRDNVLLRDNEIAHITSSGFIMNKTLDKVLLVIMIIHSVIDYKDYLQHPEYSAPFSVNLLIKGITYGIPTIIIFILSIVFKNKAKE